MKGEILLILLVSSALVSTYLYISNSTYLPVGLFILALSLLIISSSKFIHTASKIGKSLGLSDYLIGVILIGFGTSTPELVTSLYASYQGNFEIAYFNLVGSNISNILLIFGLSMIFLNSNRLVVKTNLLKTESLYLFISAIIPIILFIKTPVDSIIGIIPLLMFIVYFYINSSDGMERIDEMNSVKLGDYIVLVISLLILAFSADQTIIYLKETAKVIGVGLDLISLLALAIGTSLPELVTTILLARKGENQDILLGNIIGSNIFNTLMILGSSMITSYIVGIHSLSIQSDILETSWIFLIISTIALLLMYLDKEVYREDGVILVLMYLIFLGMVL
ncbi:MAG: hypothetical protein QXD88_01860 [Candidatus Anstonellales archaeon]